MTGSTAVTVGDAPTSGMVTFTVTASGFGTRGGNRIVVWLDTDESTATGRPPTGDDYDLSKASAPPATTSSPAPPRSPIGAPKTTPKRALAGKRLTVVFPLTRSDTGGPLTSGTVTCEPSVQGRAITHAESFTGGNARLSFTIPRNAKGKLLKVRVTIVLGSKSTTRIATFRVG